MTNTIAASIPTINELKDAAPLTRYRRVKAALSSDPSPSVEERLQLLEAIMLVTLEDGLYFGDKDTV